MKVGEGSQLQRYGETDSDRAPYISAAAVAAASFPRSPGVTADAEDGEQQYDDRSGSLLTAT
jgi:hypothetical protein